MKKKKWKKFLGQAQDTDELSDEEFETKELARRAEAQKKLEEIRNTEIKVDKYAKAAFESKQKIEVDDPEKPNTLPQTYFLPVTDAEQHIYETDSDFKELVDEETTPFKRSVFMPNVHSICTGCAIDEGPFVQGESEDVRLCEGCFAISQRGKFGR